MKQQISDLRTCVPAYLRTCVPAYLRTCVPAYLRNAGGPFARTVLSAALLLAFSEQTLAVNVATEAEYISAITSNAPNITVTQDIFLTSAVPSASGATMLNGVSGPRVKLVGNNTSRAFWSLGHMNPINDLDFKSFFSADSGGAIYSADGVSQLNNADFEDNTAAGSGGAVYVANQLGEIRGVNFKNNAATGGAGGAIYVGELSNYLGFATFTENKATDVGGAIYLREGADNVIRESRFVGNISEVSGAGLYARGGGKIEIEGTAFIANDATGSNISTLHANTVSGTAGAAYLRGENVKLSGITALGNVGRDAASNNQTAAFFYENTSGSGVLELGDSSKTTRFYGNRATDSGAYRSIFFGEGSPLQLATLQHNYSGRVLMFDPLGDAGAGGMTQFVHKINQGDWYLGGVSTMGTPNFWEIGGGSLFLTTVDYGDGAGDVAAGIDLSNTNSQLTLHSGATLAGSGSIVANNIVLRGDIAPEVWQNTGIKANAITAAISQTDIDSIDVAKTSDYGTLTFNNNVQMDGATYHVDVNLDTNQQDLLAINGALNVVNPSTVNVSSLTWSAAPPVLTDDNSLPAGIAAGVITTTSGITNGNDLHVTAGGALAGESADFLQVRGKQNGNNYDLELGLRWHSNRTVGGQADAHGDFTVSGDFALNGGLADQTAFSGNPTLHGWQGNTLTKKGNGTLTLNGVNTYTGGTQVDAGTLALGASGSVAGNVNVAGGATLAGAGTVMGNATVAGRAEGSGAIRGKLDLLANASLAAGGVSAVKQVSELNMAAGSTYEVRLDESGAASKVHATTAFGGSGAADITNADLEIINAGSATRMDWSQNTWYTILEADGGVTGEFANVTNTSAFLTHQLDYSNLNFVRLLMLRSGTSFGSICETGNQCAVGDALDELESKGVTHPVLTELAKLSDDEARRAYDNLSGEIYASTRTALLGSRLFRDTLNQRMRGHQALRLASAPVQLASVGTTQLNPATLSPGFGSSAGQLWASTWGVSDKLDGNRNAARADQSGTGLALGGEQIVAPNLLAGIALGYEDSKVKNSQGRNSKSEAKSYSIGAYAASDINGVSVRGGLAYSYLDLDTRRNIWVSGLQGKARAGYSGHRTQLFVEASQTFEFNEVELAPYAGLTQVWLTTGSVREKGSAAALQVDGQTDSVTQTTLGVRGAYRLPTATPVTLTADLGWAHAMGDVNSKTRNRFVGTDVRFGIKGVNMAKNAAIVGAGLRADLTPNAALTLDYQGQFGSGHKGHAGSLQFRWKF